MLTDSNLELRDAIQRQEVKESDTELLAPKRRPLLREKAASLVRKLREMHK